MLYYNIIWHGFIDPKYLEKQIINNWQWLLFKKGSGILGYLKWIAKCIVTRLSLSLDQFLPGGPLGLAKLWEISEVGFWRLLYYKFHKVSGWILIPLILTAIYTRIK